jgi:hypothetical protein
MGFFDVLKNVATGKPGFETPPDSSNNQQSQSGQGQVPAAPHQPVQAGPKLIPRVEIERVEVHSDPSRPHMRVSAHIQNNSQVAVEIDRIRMFGSQRELGARQLSPGQSFEFAVYDGPRPTQRGGDNDDVYVSFKDMSGDYFESRHRVEFNQEADNTYSIKRIIYTAPKDI